MAVILNIETSSKLCSISVSEYGRPLFYLSDSEEMNHAVSLAPFAKKCFNFLKEEHKQLDAVAVSLGPGSYTGLRIGLSFAKGICFSLNIPLIGISTLKILSTKAMFKYPDWQGTEKIVPMIDARRMEVYTACYNPDLSEYINEQPLILDHESFNQLFNFEKILFIGDGSKKFETLYKGNNGVWLGDDLPDAKDMSSLAELAYIKEDFIDAAYSTPNYLKDFHTTTPKNKIF